jgi:RND superfamily putative drug exporter
MARLLHRLGRFAARHGWRIVAGWVVLLAVAVGAFALFGGTLSSAITIPGTPTGEVTDRLKAEFPDASGGTALVVFHTADGAALTPAQQQASAAALARAGAVGGVARIVDPFAVEAQRVGGERQVTAGRAQVDRARAQLDAGQAQLDAARAELPLGVPTPPQLAGSQAQLDQGRAQLQGQVAALDAAADQLRLAEGVRTVSADGSTAVATVVFALPVNEIAPEVKTAVQNAIGATPIAGVRIDYSAELTQSIDGLAGPGEIVGVVIAGVVLMIMLGTLLAAGLPILSALVGVGVGVAGTLALSGVVEMVSVTPILGLMLGLAVGIDYSLFILNRHRRQLRTGLDPVESIALATGTSGNAVAFAGSTVIIALLALNVTGIPFLGMMGTVAAVCVAVAVLVAVTLTPALLGLLGRRVLPRKARGTVVSDRHAPAAPMSTRGAVLRTVLGLAVLVVVAIPALSLRLGLPDGSSEPQDSTQYRAYHVVAQEFGPGRNGPLVAVADLPAGLSEQDRTAAVSRIGAEIGAVPDVAAVAPIGTSAGGSVALYQVVPTQGPATEATSELVHALRDLTPAPSTATLGVAGQPSGNIDISDKLSGALPTYLAVVVGLSLLIMILVFRSIIVPVTATIGFVLSYFAAMGAVVAIYQWGWAGAVFGVHDPGPVLNFLPTILVGVLFGLAMDYQLFLVSGMREAYVHGAPARRAVTEGLHAGRVVVTAAAIIMFSVFGGFVFSHLSMVRPMGFGLAIGVLLDAFVVRMLVVPAVLHLSGNAAWWLPRWLDRILPDVDVEGATLDRTTPEVPQPSRANQPAPGSPPRPEPITEP